RGLFRGVTLVDPGERQDVRDSQVVQLALPLLEEEHELVARAVMIAHANLLLVPYQRLPEAKPCFHGERLGLEHRLLVAEEVEMAMLLQDAKYLAEQLGEARVGKDLKPVVAGCFAVLQSRGRSDSAMFLQ